MRIEADGRSVYELTLLLTPKEARDVIAILDQLLAAVPSEVPEAENELDDAPNEHEGGERTVRVVVYSDPATEQRQDARLGSDRGDARD